jgi:hypothetical protein
MPDSRRPLFDQPDPDELVRTERVLDALATCQPVEFGDDRGQGDRDDPGDRALAGLLEDWRDELRSSPSSVPCSELAAAAALNRALAVRRRARRSLALIGSVAATVLGIGGLGAMVGDAQPGDAFYGVHTMLFGEPPSVHDDRIALSAKTDLDQVQQMITQGQWDQAQDKLAAVSDSVQTVNDNDRKQDLIDQVNSLNAKVTNRDPNATVSSNLPPNPSVGPVTETTTPVTETEAGVTAPVATSDGSATASDASVGVSVSPSAADAAASLSPTSSMVPAVSMTVIPTAVPSDGPDTTTQLLNSGGS